MQVANENSMFVKLDEYKEVMTILQDMKNTIADANKALEKANAIRKEEDAEIEMWNKSIKDIETRIHMMDKTLFDAGNKR